MNLKPARQFLEAVIVRLAFGICGMLPVDWASGAGAALGRNLGPRMGLSRVARANLRAAFPERSEAELEAILIECWENLGRVACEFPHIERLALERTEVIGAEFIHLLRDDGKAGIFFSGHLGNWEVSGAVSRREGLPIHLIYREANNPWIESIYRRGRASITGGLIPKGSQGAREALTVLKEGGHLGMLVDQKMNDGIAIPFLGRDAMTAPALAQFAYRHDCPVVPARVERLNGARFRVTILPPLDLPATGDRHEDIRVLMTRINAILETWVRDRPGQWLWMHKRWPD